MTVRSLLGLMTLVGVASMTRSAQDTGPTCAERLGWPKGTRALILHVDDVGMSWDTELGTMKGIEKVPQAESSNPSPRREIER